MAATKQLRTAIVDDEPLARRLLKSLLDRLPEVEVVAQYATGGEAVQGLPEISPDLLILDVQMPGLTGFDVIQKLQSDVMPLVIFCTAYQRYALDAFDLHAVDYLLKPVSEERLQRAVARALQRHADNLETTENKSPVLGAIEEITRRVGGRGDALSPAPDKHDSLLQERKIAIRDNDQVRLVEIDDIDWIDAAGDYMCVHAEGQTHIMRGTMKKLEDILDPRVFQRVHRSTIVNVNRVRQVRSHINGEYFLILDGDVELKMSRHYKDKIAHFVPAV